MKVLTGSSSPRKLNFLFDAFCLRADDDIDLVKYRLHIGMLERIILNHERKVWWEYPGLTVRRIYTRYCEACFVEA